MLPTFSNSARTFGANPQFGFRSSSETTEAGYRPPKAGCLALKSVFVIFFQKTTFWRDKYENQPVPDSFTEKDLTIFSDKRYYNRSVSR